MPDIRMIDNPSRQDWDDFVMSCDSAIAWHRYEWIDILKKHHPVDFHPIAALDGSRIVGVLPLYRLHGSETLISVPFAVAGGIVSDSPEVRNALLREAVRRASTIDNGKVALKQYKVRIDGELTTDDHYYNRELDISVGRKEVWNNLDPRNREMIEATRNASTVLEYPSEDVGSYFRMLLTHLRDHGIPCPSRSWIEDLLRFRMYKLAILRQDGKMAAATLVKEFRDTVSFPFTCHAPRNEKQVYRLYWELILNYQEAGFRIVHSGRIPNNDDTDAYRLGWGGKKHAYFYQYHPGTSATEYSKKRGIKRRLVEKCWKNLPVSVAGAIGPMIVRRFP